MYLMHGDMQAAPSPSARCSPAPQRVGVDVDCWLALTRTRSGRAPTARRTSCGIERVTIQVVHSDAEGRMVLADTLALASREKPGLLLDFATLTGACVNALTDRYSGPSRTDQTCRRAAGGRERKRRARLVLPMTRLRPRTGMRGCRRPAVHAGIQGRPHPAARFLSKFVSAGLPWVHFDLAAAEHKGVSARPTEFTGFGVRYALRLLNDRASWRRSASSRDDDFAAPPGRLAPAPPGRRAHGAVLPSRRPLRACARDAEPEAANDDDAGLSDYRARILAALPAAARFEPLMTLYLTDRTPRKKSAALVPAFRGRRQALSAGPRRIRTQA